MPKHEIEIPEDVEKTLQGRTVLAVRKPIDGEWVASSSGPVQFVGTSIFDYLILSPPKPELHRHCPYCGANVDGDNGRNAMCWDCWSSGGNEWYLANDLPIIQPSAAPPTVLLPKPWAKPEPAKLPEPGKAFYGITTNGPPEPAKEQPPTLPEGWMLREPNRQALCIADMYQDEDGHIRCCVKSGEPSGEYWIVRQKVQPQPDPRESLAKLLVSLSSKLASAAGDLCDAAQLAEDASRAEKAAESQPYSASATLAELESDPRKKAAWIYKNGAAAYLKLMEAAK